MVQNYTIHMVQNELPKKEINGDCFNQLQHRHKLSRIII